MKNATNRNENAFQLHAVTLESSYSARWTGDYSAVRPRPLRAYRVTA